MTRGVNRNVIEISDTGNECFERAILFVRPSSAEEDAEQLRRNAALYLSSFRRKPWFYSKQKIWAAILKVVLGALLGAGITAAFLLV